LKLYEPDVLADLIEKGYKQAENFAWGKSARVLYQICEQLVAKK